MKWLGFTREKDDQTRDRKVHMVKGKWITIMLDSVDDERIKWLLDMSFELTKGKI